MDKNKKLNKKILIFTAHPDDHLCCAGSLMYFHDLGFKITEVVFTGGENSMWLNNSFEGKEIDKEKLKEKLKNHRKKEILNASKAIGIDETIFLGLPDGNVQRSLEVLDMLVGIIRKVRPQIVISMNPFDSHYDHKKVGEIAGEAAERAGWMNSKELGISYRIPLFLYMEGTLFGRNDILIDISKYIKKKEKIFSIYKSQITDGEKKMLYAMNIYRGFHKGSELAEAFEIARDLPAHLNEIIDIFKSKS